MTGSRKGIINPRQSCEWLHRENWNQLYLTLEEGIDNVYCMKHKTGMVSFSHIYYFTLIINKEEKRLKTLHPQVWVIWTYNMSETNEEIFGDSLEKFISDNGIPENLKSGEELLIPELGPSSIRWYVSMWYTNFTLNLGGPTKIPQSWK